METFTIKPIGYVKNSFEEVVKMPEIRTLMNGISVIEVLEEYTEGLFRVEEQEFLNIIFYFNKSEGYEFLCNTPLGEQRGVFACRSPKRPNSLGTTTVKLIKREKNKLFVTGLDAINNTPIIDIKNANTVLLETNPTYIPRYQANPRVDIEKLIEQKDTKSLLIKSAQLHNHFCPGLTYGVMASILAMKSAKEVFGNWQEISATVETKSCFMDGVQMVTGCTIANKELVCNDLENLSISLTKKGKDKTIKVSLKPSKRNYITEKFTKFTALKEKIMKKEEIKPEDIMNFKMTALETAFKIVELDPELLFTVEIQ